MARRRLRWVMLFGVALLLACGGGGDDDSTAIAPPQLPVARLVGADQVLELPLLRSGQLAYADVRLQLRKDGTFRALSGREVRVRHGAVDATLAPAVPLAALPGHAAAVTLTVRRMHLHDRVFQSVTIELRSGRWRLQGPLRSAQALTGKDFADNPRLRAHAGQVVALHARPSQVQVVRLRLERRSYSFCRPANARNQDEIALLDAAGKVLASTRGGQDCIRWDATAGDYQLRHRHDGTGPARTVFMRPRPAPAVMQVQETQAGLQAVADNGPEFLGIFVVQPPNSGADVASGFLTNVRIGLRASECLTAVAALVQANGTDLGPGTWRYPVSLFDADNFFESVGAGADTPALLGRPFGCAPDSTGTYLASDQIVQYFDRDWDQDYPPMVAMHPWSGTSVGMYIGTSFVGMTYAARIGTEVLRLLAPDDYGHIPSFDVVLRYRPGGAGTLAPGQFALFDSTDCTGAAMVVDNFDLPATSGGSLGNFTGSMLLGERTRVTVFPQEAQQGNGTIVNASGCLVQGSGAVPYVPASFAVAVDDMSEVVVGDGCPRCNLSGLDFTFGGTWAPAMPGADFAGANLDGANLPLGDLSDASLVGASLRGTRLGNANLSGANMCGARLDPAPGTAAAPSAGGADLSGAYMPYVNLNGADLSSAILTNASFFGKYKRSCAPSDCGSTKALECAGAAGATLAGTSFAGAYLANTDFGGATKYPDFSNAILVGATFDAAGFSTDENGKGVVFTGALLMGATFDNAAYPNAVFTGASTDTTGGCWNPLLSAAHTAFRGYAQPVPGNSRECQAAPAAPICVFATYSGTAALPPGIPLRAPVASAIGSTCLASSNVCNATGGTAAPVVTNTACFQAGKFIADPPLAPVIIEPIGPPPGGAPTS